MAAINDLIRKAKMFFTSVALVQKYKISVFETKDAEESERFQDYGFTSQPSEGEGLVIDAGGAVMVLRVDRLKDRPSIDKDEVAVWHKDGAKIHLKTGKIIDIDCDTLNIHAKVAIEGESLTHNGKNIGSDHTHGGVSKGGDSTRAPD